MTLLFTDSKDPQLLAVQLFSESSNLCDHRSLTSQTEGRTDGQTGDLPWQPRAGKMWNMSLIQRI